MTYDYFENIDGTIFRRERKPDGSSWDGYPVREILTRDGWRPFTGDRVKPVAFGNRIDPPSES